MKQSSSWRGPSQFNSALLQYRDVEGIGELVITGAFTQSNATVLRLEALNHIARGECSGLVVDLRRTSLALDDDSVEFHCPGDLDDVVRLRPIAVVVKPEFETLFMQWVWEMATKGLMRGAFTRIDEAREWVRSRAGLSIPRADSDA